MEEQQIDIVIIGAGTAGMSAAIYALRTGRSVKLFEQKALGGQIVNASRVENYPGIESTNGYEFVMKLYGQVKSFGGEVVYEKVEDIIDKDTCKEIVTNKNTYLAKAVIVATGTQKAVLGLENEKQLTGKGVSYCATCDGAFYRGKTVAVVGGGSTALEDGLFLANYCARVYMIHRRDRFTGEEKYVDELKARDNVAFVMNSEIVKISGQEKLSGVTVFNRVSQESTDLAIDGLFIAIGQNPQNTDFADILELDERGYILAGEDCKTTNCGIYAAGDCRTKKVRQLTTAAADGAVAALGASAFAGRKR